MVFPFSRAPLRSENTLTLILWCLARRFRIALLKKNNGGGSTCVYTRYTRRYYTSTHNSSFGTEQGLLRLLRTQPHRKYQSHVHNSLLRTHQFVLVPKLPLRGKLSSACFTPHAKQIKLLKQGEFGNLWEQSSPIL